MLNYFTYDTQIINGVADLGKGVIGQSEGLVSIFS